MSAIFNLALLFGGAAAFLLADGPGKIGTAFGSVLDRTKGDESPVQGPIDEGNKMPEITVIGDPDFVPFDQRDSTPSRNEDRVRDEDFTITELPGTSIPIARPVQGPTRP